MERLDRTVTRIQSLSNLLDAALTATMAQISVQQNEDMRAISAWVAIAVPPGGRPVRHELRPLPELHWRYGCRVLGLAVVAGLMYAASNAAAGSGVRRAIRAPRQRC
jgi:magnesium transporter